MCGIAGVVGPGADESELTMMLRVIAHRGEPAYRAESLVRPGLVMGTNRLAIVDETQGDQPFVSADGTVACVINGEIYNHTALREELQHIHAFTSECDSEVVLAGYLAWGTEVFPRLRGMFGVAIHDARTNSLTLARDPLGIKPLYLARRAGDVLFASELKALTAVEVADVEEMLPGTLLHGGACVRYWDYPEPYNDRESAEGALARLGEVLREAVCSHVPGTGVTVPCLLSGGVDSSTVLALARAVHPGPVEAWTFTTGTDDSLDLVAAREVCAHLDVPLRIVAPDKEELMELYLGSGVWLTETWEPALVRNAVSYHVLCRAVRRAGHKFCLSGEGADEVFGGYDYFSLLPEEGRDRSVRESLRQIYRTYLQMSDRASMYATLEVRVPFMDRQVVETAAALPDRYRFRDGVNKWALRTLYPGFLPERIAFRAKLGMNSGAGFGSNDPSDGIYARAVQNRYMAEPDRWSHDLAIAEDLGPLHGVDTANLEEVHNFASYVKHSFHRLELQARPQVNVSAIRV